MAARQFTSKSHASRKTLPPRGPFGGSGRRPALAHSTESRLIELRDAIEDERDRLGKADSVLGCLSMALMDAEEGDHKDLPYFADVADVARKLVRRSINQLDSVRIGPLIDRIRRPRARS